MGRSGGSAVKPHKVFRFAKILCGGPESNRKLCGRKLAYFTTIHRRTGAPGSLKRKSGRRLPILSSVIFKKVGDGRPYQDHGLSVTEWAQLPPTQVRLAELITTKRTLDLDALLAEDSTFFGDLFAHVVKYKGDLYLEDGLHRAVRAALQQRPLLHARVLDLDTVNPEDLHNHTH